MLLALLILLQVVQANEFVEFRICYLDTQPTPWEFRPHPRNKVFYARRDQIVYVSELSFHHAGLDCIRICSANGCNFVRGTVSSVMESLRGSGNAAD